MHDELNLFPERDPEDALDRMLCHELHWEVPPELTARLLSLVALPLPVARLRPRPWYSGLVLLLTAVAIGLSLTVAWQFYAILGNELGFTAIWEQFQLQLTLGMQQAYESFPLSRYALALLLGVRNQLHWLLLAAVLWLALDGWTPKFALRVAGA